MTSIGRNCKPRVEWAASCSAGRRVCARSGRASGLGQPRQRDAQRSGAGPQTDLGQLGRGLHGRLQRPGRRGRRGGGAGSRAGDGARVRVAVRRPGSARPRAWRAPAWRRCRGGGLGRPRRVALGGGASAARRPAGVAVGAGVAGAGVARLPLRRCGRVLGSDPITPGWRFSLIASIIASDRVRRPRAGAIRHPDAENRPSPLKRPGELVVYIECSTPGVGCPVDGPRNGP